jgi:hypothetical protein
MINDCREEWKPIVGFEGVHKISAHGTLPGTSEWLLATPGSDLVTGSPDFSGIRGILAGDMT